MPLVDPSKPEDKVADSDARRDIVQRASIAQLLLVARLRARTRRDLAVDSLERAVQVMLVTCKNWFSSGRKNVKPIDLVVIPPEKIEGADAHRDH